MASQAVIDSPAPPHVDRRGFLRRWIFSTDHKVIGIQYIITGLLMALVGAALASLIRLQLGWPDHAWPILKSLHVPATLYLPSNFPDHLGVLWWLALEQIVARNDRIGLPPPGTIGNFLISTWLAGGP